MSKRIRRIPFEELPAELAAQLAPRVERLGYLGEFFQCAAQQPHVLRSFQTFTDDLKAALPDDLTEVVALTVAREYGNDYERHQHERLCRRLGFTDDWILAVEACAPASGGALTDGQRAAQRLVLALLARRGRDVGRPLEALIDAIGEAPAMALLLLVGRYVTHSLVVNALALEPPVASIFPAGERGPQKRPRTLYLGEAEVSELLSLDDAIPALEEGLRREARGEAANMVKTHVAWSGGTLHAIGAVFTADGVTGAKTWAHTGGGAAPRFVLFDAADGAVLAVIEAFALGQMRTGGMSAVATRWLAAAGADELAIAGSGRQAMMQVRAVAAVRPLRRVRVYSPTAAHRAAFAAALRRDLGFEVVEAESAAEAIAGAPIVTLVTRAREPFVGAADIAPGAHVNAVGAITPERAEFAPALLGRCEVVAVDCPDAARRLSRELRQHFEGRGWEGVTRLAEVVAAARPRPAGGPPTLFKAMGMGIGDLALALEVYRRACERGMGSWIR